MFVFDAAHAGVEVVAEEFEFFDAFDGELGGLIAGGSLDEDAGEAEPAFDDVGAKVDVLDARVVHDGFAAEEDAPFHGDAVVGEFVAHGVILEEEWEDDEDECGREGDGAEHIIFEEGGIGTFDGVDALLKCAIDHEAE